MIIFAKKLKESTKMLPELNVFRTFTGYRINIQRSIICLYSNSKQLEIQIKIQFIITLNNMKYFGVNLMTYV